MFGNIKNQQNAAFTELFQVFNDVAVDIERQEIYFI